MKVDRRLTALKEWQLPDSKIGQQELRREMERRGMLRRFNKLIAPIEQLIAGAASCILEFIHSNGYLVRRHEWESEGVGSALQNYNGWVYAFFNAEDEPIYIGETSRTFGERFREHSTKKAIWWSDWRAVKLLPCPNQSVRKIFESIAGLSEAFVGNKLQPPIEGDIFNDILLSLMLLGSDGNSPIDFLHENVEINIINVKNHLREINWRKRQSVRKS